jgi:hypothetical protein
MLTIRQRAGRHDSACAKRQVFRTWPVVRQWACHCTPVCCCALSAPPSLPHHSRRHRRLRKHARSQPLRIPLPAHTIATACVMLGFGIGHGCAPSRSADYARALHMHLSCMQETRSAKRDARYLCTSNTWPDRSALNTAAACGSMIRVYGSSSLPSSLLVALSTTEALIAIWPRLIAAWYSRSQSKWLYVLST